MCWTSYEPTVFIHKTYHTKAYDFGIRIAHVIANLNGLAHDNITSIGLNMLYCPLNF